MRTSELIIGPSRPIVNAKSGHTRAHGPSQRALLHCRLGFLDPSSDEENLKKSTKLELPLWLAKHLYNMYCVDIQLPEAFSSYSVNVMRADSSIVDLKRLQPNYYQV